MTQQATHVRGKNSSRPTDPRTGRSAMLRAAVIAAAAGVAVVGGVAQGDEPFDVNAVRPAGRGGRTVVLPEPVAPVGREGSRPGEYSVSRFALIYKFENENHPDGDDIARAAMVTLAMRGGIMVAPSETTGKPFAVSVGDLMDGVGSYYTAPAINEIAKAIVEAFNRAGLVGVFVQPHPSDVDARTGVDLRKGERSDLRLIVWTGQVASVRSLALGERFEKDIAKDGSLRTDNPNRVHVRIREESPVTPGGLVNKNAIDEYVLKLNRHPGRRVDVAVAPGAEPGDVTVDYLINESKQWALFAQGSNTGTKNTSEWRERLGFVHNQLTGRDDILSIDYVTAGFDNSHAFVGSYERPVWQDVRARVYGSYSEYDASDVGLAGETFSGKNYGAGAELAWNFWQKKDQFLDLVGGVRYSNVEVTNTVFAQEGKTGFLIPSIGVRYERLTDDASTRAGLSFEGNLPDLAGTDEAELPALGRLNSNDDWTLVRYNFDHSFYIEPWLVRNGYPSIRGYKMSTLAHELSFSLRGQYAFDYRLVPGEQEVAGGLYSVRGYPQSVIVGDSMAIGSFEYRFHLPRMFPVSAPGMVGSRKVGMMGDSFAWAPSQPFGRADWDLILRSFVDVAKSEVSNRSGSEKDRWLAGAGIGAELQFGRNVSARADLGWALVEVDDAANPVDLGNVEAHFQFTVLY